MPSTPLYNFTNVKLEPVQNPDLARTIAVKLKASTVFTRGTILGELTAQPGVYAPYNPAGADGTQVPKAILAYDVTTDADGKPTGMTHPYPPFPDLSVPAYVRGEFDCATIDTAMGDAGAILSAALNVPGFGALEQGSATAGIFRLG